MCPAVEGTAYVGGGTHGCRPTGDNRRVRRVPAAGCGHPALRVRGKGARCGRDVEDAVPYAEHEVPACGASGKSAKRRRWRKKRAGFEEVPRLAATTVDGNRLARRWAIAAPYGGITNGAAVIGGGVRAPRPAEATLPDDGRRIFIKMSFRGAKQRGNPYSSYDKKRGAWGDTDRHTGDIGHWLAMTGFEVRRLNAAAHMGAALRIFISFLQ